MSERNYREGKLLYHVTALENLESILKNGLLSRVKAEKEGLIRTDVADKEIIRKRRELGILDSVPFHFFEPTPFTDCIFKGKKETTFITISIQRKLAEEKNFRIATRHPLNSRVEILPYYEGIEKIDWDVMNKRDYADDECKITCMAECLSASIIMPENFHCIFVPDKEVEDKVKYLKMSLRPEAGFFITVNEKLSKKAVLE